ncbi:MAG: 6-phosphogluconate dehydrogenase [Flavobacteriaceae bacterium]|jgi:6-phosphogluconate dehydrogenase|tara:strand:+ start:283 stop:1701 length:1419 start_codon:yes stop_codon:yes gene_type:complete
MSNQPSWGIVGLGVMGTSLGRNLADKGVALAIYNREVEGTEEAVALMHTKHYSELKNALPFDELAPFINTLKSPRKLLLMLPAGSPTDAVITHLTPLLAKGDVIIEGGNSHFKDTEERAQQLAAAGIHFLGMGVSGGEEGALKGPSLMVGGTEEAYALVKKDLHSIAGKNSKGLSCCNYLGSGGAGHFVKMVHNGIEYAEMQLLAEVISLALSDPSNNIKTIQKMLQDWQTTASESYLLGITARLLGHQEAGRPFIDFIKDEAYNKGTGAWATAAGAELGSANSLMASALHARFTSSNKKQRSLLSKTFKVKPTLTSLSLSALKVSYDLSRIVNHHQGFEMICKAALKNNWKIEMATIASLWSEGCIIKSRLMDRLMDVFKTNETLLDTATFMEYFSTGNQEWEATLVSAIQHRIPFSCHSAAWDYFLAITQEDSAANIIQAQRDFFGAHGFERKDKDSGKKYHGPWAAKTK